MVETILALASFYKLVVTFLKLSLYLFESTGNPNIWDKYF